MHSSVLSITLATAFLAALPAAANDILRSVDERGRVIYSDRVITGTQIIERIPQVRMNVEETRASIERANALARAGEAFDRRYTERNQSLAREEWALRDAQARISIAERALLSGEVPLPGEVRGNRNGGARLTEDYWARQNELRLDLERAEIARDAARARINAVR